MPFVNEPIAIVGISAIHPGSVDAQGFWMDIVAGRDLISDVPSHYWLIEDFYHPDPKAPDKTYARRGAFLSRIPFDAREFGIPPAALPATDSAQLLALIGAKRVLEDAASGRTEYVARDRISVILGVAGATSSALHTAGRLQRPSWVKGLREEGLPEEEVQAACDRIAANFTPLQENTFPGLLSNVVAGRIANRFDLGGSNFVVDAACAGSLAAVSVAMNELHLHQADMVITGGVDAMNDVLMFMCFSKTPAFSPSGDCRPFSDRADGTLIGEGLSMFALRRLSDAERDGDRIYALIRGLGSSSDGRAKSVYAPRPQGQALALRRAYSAAGFDPGTVELMEAHGTGTPTGDVAEFEALRSVYESSGRGDLQWCALGSVKSQIGHTKAAAGAAALFKAAMALHHKVLPPTIKVEALNPKLNVPDSPFYINTESRPWIGNQQYPRRAAVSSFGFGGTNFHAVLEEYSGDARRQTTYMVGPDELVLLSAFDAAHLADTCLQLGRQVAEGLDLRTAAHRSQKTFDPTANSRLAVIAERSEALIQKLESAAKKLQAGNGAFSDRSGMYYAAGALSGKLAFIFAGQGSQYPGMGKDLAIYFEAARHAWELTDSTLAHEVPRFHDTVFPLPAFTDEDRKRSVERLTRTDIAQPAIAAASFAQLAVIRNLGLVPDIVAGHSFGEIVALHFAGVINAPDLVRIARKRGALMAAAAQGAMVAVQRSAQEVQSILNQLNSDIVIANYNAPTQVVVSGPVNAITAFERALKASSIPSFRLPVSAAFHSPLMAPSVEPFSRFLADVEVLSPKIPVLSNTQVGTYPAEPEEIRAMLAKHLISPVQFAQQIDELYARGVRKFVEVGPGSVLTGLVDACLTGREHLAVSLDQKGRHGISALWHSLAQLAVSGVRLNLTALWPAFAPVPAPLPESNPNSTFLIDGSNYGKPYPPLGGAAALPKPNVAREKTPIPSSPEPSQTLRQDYAAMTVTNNLPESSSISYSEPPAPLVNEIQKQITQAQKASHDAILESLKLTLHSLASLTGNTIAHVEHQPPMVRVPEEILPNHAAEPALAEMAPAPIIHPDPTTSAPNGTASLQAAAPPTPSASPGQLFDPADRLLQIVSEKTGYPIEVLDLEADLEAGLGVDSIKRVEIFSALQEQVPGLPELKPENMASLRTLRQIASFLQPAKLDGTESARPEIRQNAVHQSASMLDSAEPGLPLPFLFRCERIAIIPDASGVAEILATRLTSLGISTEVINELDDRFPGLIYLGALSPFDNVDGPIACNRAAFLAAQILARNPASNKLFVTVQDLGGDFGLSGVGSISAWSAGVGALTKTVAAECADTSVKTIDVAVQGRSAESIADAIVSELVNGGPELEVALNASGVRRTFAAVQRDVPLTAHNFANLGPNPVLVVSGGARGVTAACVLELVKATRARVALLGRTTLTEEGLTVSSAQDEQALKCILISEANAQGQPINLISISEKVAYILAQREIRRNLRELETHGAQVMYLSTDLQNRRAVEDALQHIRSKWGPITGVIHGAGVLADKRIVEKTETQFDRVFDTKVNGLRNLLAVTESDPLRIVCLFSSVAARYGNAGQCDYAMANEVLNKVAAVEARRRGSDCVVKSIGWGPWEGGMVDSALAALFESRGVALLPISEGSRAFVKEISGSDPTAEVLITANGSPVLATSPHARQTTEILVNLRTFPFLNGHRIRTDPVVPVVLVLEWFYRAAAAFHPRTEVSRCEDLRVLSGIVLDNFDGKGHLLSLHCYQAETDASKLQCELRSANGKLHYTATLRTNQGNPEQCPEPLPEVLHLNGHNRNGSAKDLYSELLFHGPEFQVIRTIHDIGDAGASATLSGTRAMHWRTEGVWKTEAAGLDGALQVLRLWTKEQMGELSLPTRIGQFISYTNELVPDSLACIARCRIAGKLRSIADVTLASKDGRRLAELFEVEMHIISEGEKIG